MLDLFLTIKSKVGEQMGRQVNFICTKNDIATIIEFIHTHDASFYKDCYAKKEFFRVDNVSAQENLECYWIFLNQYYQQIGGEYILENCFFEAEVIQFTKEAYIDEMFYCRIWACFGFWTKINGVDSYVYKPKDFEKFYSSLARFIKKKALVEKSKSFWFMQDAYQICKERNLVLPNPASSELQLELP